MRRQTLFLLFMILFSLPLTVLAQGTKTVKGTVVDQNNEPIIGATVVVKGSPRRRNSRIQLFGHVAAGNKRCGTIRH